MYEMIPVKIWKKKKSKFDILDLEKEIQET
jgi:hypothetical protein